MTTVHEDKSGFSAIEVTFVIIIIVIIGAVGWLVYKDYHKKTVPTDSNITSTTATGTTSSSGTYTGWKTYCDNATKVCFKYPAHGWTTIPANTLSLMNVSNSSGLISVIYGEQNSNGGGAFHTTSITATNTSGSSVEIVGGYYTAAANPIISYYLISTSLVKQYGLSVGKTSTIPNSGGAWFAIGSTVYTITASYAGTTPGNAWTTTADGATALQIMKSVTIGQ